jgi:hypothetical protein
MGFFSFCFVERASKSCTVMDSGTNQVTQSINAATFVENYAAD